MNCNCFDEFCKDIRMYASAKKCKERCKVLQSQRVIVSPRDEHAEIHKGKLQPHCVAGPLIKQVKIVSFTLQLFWWSSFRP
jgi:hypothetical protein